MDKIGLIEDDSLLRHIYSHHFKTTGAFEVTFSVAGIAEALDLTITSPQIILLDVNLGNGSGIDGITALTQHFPQSKIVIFSTSEDPALTKQAMHNGAIGYLLKSSSLSYITESLLKVTEGGTPFSPATISHLINSKNLQAASGNENVFDLTKRELELIALLSEGMANKTAADKLNVTYFTINQHLKNIYKKLNINSKSELISWYLNR